MFVYYLKFKCGVSFSIFLIFIFWNILVFFRILFFYSYFLSIYKYILYYNCLFKRIYDLNKLKYKIFMFVKVKIYLINIRVVVGILDDIRIMIYENKYVMLFNFIDVYNWLKMRYWEYIFRIF